MRKQIFLLRVGVSILMVVFILVIQANQKTQSAEIEANRYFPRDGDFVQVGYPPKGLHYVRRGKGPTVVLLHGDGGSTYDWTLANVDRLARRYDVIALDRPGFGFSETLPHQSILSQVRYIHRGLQLMGIRRPVLVGHSRGGEIATLFAEEYPDEIAGVVTLGGVCFNNPDSEPEPDRSVLGTSALGSWLVRTFHLLPTDQSSLKAGLTRAFAPEGPAPDAYTKVYTALLMRPQTQLNRVIDRNPAVLDTLIIPRYDSIRVPFVVVHGQADQNVPIAMARRFSRLIPGARLIELPGAGHQLMFHHPAVVEQAINMVLQKAPAKP